MFPTKRPSGTPLYTSSGNVSIISPGDVVQILDEREYRVLRINPHSSTVILGRVDASTNQRSFMRPSTSICTLPATTRDIAVKVNEPTGNCLCEVPPPPVLPDVADISISCNLDVDDYVNSTHPEFDSVSKLQQGFEEAKLAANAAFKELCTEVLKVTELKEKINSLQQRITTHGGERRSFKTHNGSNRGCVCPIGHNNKSTLRTRNAEDHLAPCASTAPFATPLNNWFQFCAP